MSALLFGQGGSFTSLNCNFDTGNKGSSANSLCSPQGLAVDAFASHLYVADTGNTRALEYTAPLTPNTTANEVFGRGESFTSNSCNAGGVSTNSLCFPVAGTADLVSVAMPTATRARLVRIRLGRRWTTKTYRSDEKEGKASP